MRKIKVISDICLEVFQDGKWNVVYPDHVWWDLFLRLARLEDLQEPKEVKYPEDNQEQYACPTCGEKLGFGDDYFGEVTELKNGIYCRKCGQRMAIAAGECSNNELKTPVSALDVQTPLGTLHAYASFNENYPGIYIDLVRDGYRTDAPLALIEYTETEGDMKDFAYIISRVWKDATEDDYSDRIVHDKIEDFFTCI